MGSLNGWQEKARELRNREWGALKGGGRKGGEIESLQGGLAAEGEDFLFAKVPLCLSEPCGKSFTCDMIESFQNSSLHVFQVRGWQCLQQIISACTHAHFVSKLKLPSFASLQACNVSCLHKDTLLPTNATGLTHIVTATAFLSQDTAVHRCCLHWCRYSHSVLSHNTTLKWLSTLHSAWASLKDTLQKRLQTPATGLIQLR